MIEYILKSIWFFLPMGFANMAPVFVKKINILNIPIDFNKKINGVPILGVNKTIRGLLAATIVGGIIFLLQKILFIPEKFQERLRSLFGSDNFYNVRLLKKDEQLLLI